MNPTCHYQSQYDRMVQEKDAELEEKKKNEMEATAREKSLVPRNMLSSTNNDWPENMSYPNICITNFSKSGIGPLKA